MINLIKRIIKKIKNEFDKRKKIREMKKKDPFIYD
jgi:hypothetical protein